MSLIRFIVFLLATFHLLSAKAEEDLVKTSLALDTLYQFSDENTQDNRLLLRSAEISFSGAVDHYLTGHLSIAAHEEDGQYNFELHEGYLQTASLIPNSLVKVGKFFLNIGKLNTTHQHDWNFSNAPKVHKTFLDDEAVGDVGIEYQWLAPTDNYFSITLGLTNGYTWGHTHSAGVRPTVPVHYIHPQIYWLNSSSGGLLTGLTYLGRTDHDNNKYTLIGLDNTYKYRVGKKVDWQFLSEVWMQAKTAADGSTEDQAGAYFFIEKNISDIWYLGLREDLFTNLSQKFISGPSQKNLDYDTTIQATARFSEFSLVRFSYTYKVQSDQGESDLNENYIAAQLTIILGDHPSHDF